MNLISSRIGRLVSRQMKSPRRRVTWDRCCMSEKNIEYRSLSFASSNRSNTSSEEFDAQAQAMLCYVHQVSLRYEEFQRGVETKVRSRLYFVLKPQKCPEIKGYDILLIHLHTDQPPDCPVYIYSSSSSSSSSAAAASAASSSSESHAGMYLRPELSSYHPSSSLSVSVAGCNCCRPRPSVSCSMMPNRCIESRGGGVLGAGAAAAVVAKFCPLPSGTLP